MAAAAVAERELVIRQEVQIGGKKTLISNYKKTNTRPPPQKTKLQNTSFHQNKQQMYGKIHIIC